MILSNKKIFFYICCILFFLQTNAQDIDNKKTYFQGYSGGMTLHTGYLWGGVVSVNIPPLLTEIQGMPFGMGGLLRFHFGKHFRFGGEGYNSTLYYGENKSYTSLSWGGLLLDCQWKINKFTLFFGGTIGGGSVKNITILNNVSNQTIEKNAVYRKYNLMVVDPFIGVEYAIANKIHLIAKVDCIFNITKKQPDFAVGPRFYAGIVFFHAKKLSNE
jgi:hypothetical protein